MVFQATPQETPSVRQPRPQIERLASLVSICSGAMLPSGAWPAEASMLTTGKITNSRISPAISSTAPETNTSPRNCPLRAMPMASSIRQASA